MGRWWRYATMHTLLILAISLMGPVGCRAQPLSIAVADTTVSQGDGTVTLSASLSAGIGNSLLSQTQLAFTPLWQSSNPNVASFISGTSNAYNSLQALNAQGTFVIGQPGQTTISCSFIGTVGTATLTVTASPRSAPFGDGSQGAVTINADTDWTAIGVPGGTPFPQFTRFVVSPGVTLTVPSGVDIWCQGDATVNGKIRVVSWNANNGPYDARQNGDVPGPSGQAGTPLSVDQASGIFLAGFWGGGCGLGGGQVGRGGGCFTLRAAKGLSIGPGGSINASAPAAGFDGVIPAAGGGGGVVVLAWGKGSKFTNNGVPGIVCNGADGGAENAGGGGGGLVRLIGPGASTSASNGISVTAGKTGSSRSPVGIISRTGGSTAGSGAEPGGTATSGKVVPTDVGDPTSILPNSP